MRTKRLKWSLIVLVVIGLPPSIHAQQYPGKVQPSIELKGSVPPIAEWYSCVASIGGRSFSQADADQCLRSILSHPHLTSGRVLVSAEGAYTEVTFLLESPSLRLTQLDFVGLSEDSLPEFQRFISQNDEVLKKGAEYDPREQMHTQTKLEEFLRSKGIKALISKDVTLDYQQKAAAVVFRVWQGPNVTPEEPLLPGKTDCQTYVGSVNNTDIDNYTPLPLVESIVAPWRSACFSQSLIRNAEDELKETGLFTSASLDVEASDEWRNITLHVRTRQTPVAEVLSRWYGTLSGEHTEQLPVIPLKAGETYTRAAAVGSREILIGQFKKPGSRVVVTEENMLNPNHTLTVVFDILGAKPDVLSMDGQVLSSDQCCF